MSNVTNKLIVDMLTENTGTHFLDSGGADNRNWQKNQKIDFENELYVDSSDGYPYISIYHYLNDILSLDDRAIELNKKLDKFNSLYDDSFIHWTGEMKDNLDIDKFLNYENTNISKCYNTYNGESFLSQVLQYFTVCLNDDDDSIYIFLQIHGGADVRGGYTSGRWFKLNSYLDHTPTVYAETKCGKSLSTSYNGYSFTYEDCGNIENNLIDSEVDDDVDIINSYIYTEASDDYSYIYKG